MILAYGYNMIKCEDQISVIFSNLSFHLKHVTMEYDCSTYLIVCFLAARKEHAEASYQLMTVQKRLENLNHFVCIILAFI